VRDVAWRWGVCVVIKSFAHILLLAFGLTILGAVLVACVATGFLGDAWQNKLLSILRSSSTFYANHKDTIDLSFKTIGLLGSGIAGVFALHKGWFYAEQNLPKRLEEYLKRTNARSITTRKILIPSLAEVTALTDLPSVFIPPPRFEQLFAIAGLDPRGRKIKEIEAQIEPLSQQIAILEDKQRSCRTQKGTALFVQGLELARSATVLGSNSLDSRQRNRQAYDAIKAAVELDSSDLDALELAVKQAFALRMEPDALKFSKQLENKSETVGDEIRRGRALRFQAEILCAKSDLRSWNEARPKAAAAVAILQGIDGTDDLQKHELGRALEALVAIQLLREKLMSAQTELDRAKALYDSVAEPWKSQGLARVTDLKKRLDEALRDS
jgi:hypothetical protein